MFVIPQHRVSDIRIVGNTECNSWNPCRFNILHWNNFPFLQNLFLSHDSWKILWEYFSKNRVAIFWERGHYCCARVATSIIQDFIQTRRHVDGLVTLDGLDKSYDWRILLMDKKWNRILDIFRRQRPFMKADPLQYESFNKLGLCIISFLVESSFRFIYEWMNGSVQHICLLFYIRRS